MNITIQKAIIEDIPDIQDVFYYTWLDTYPNKEAGVTKEDIEEDFKDRKSHEKIAEMFERFTNMTENKLFLVAKQKNKTVGICRLIKKTEYNELKVIYILPGYQGNGIGQMFWEKAKEFFENEKDIIVRVASYNQKAISFYQKLGFRDTGKRFKEERLKMPISGTIMEEMEMIFSFKKTNN